MPVPDHQQQSWCQNPSSEKGSQIPVGTSFDVPSLSHPFSFLIRTILHQYLPCLDFKWLQIQSVCLSTFCQVVHSSFLQESIQLKLSTPPACNSTYFRSQRQHPTCRYFFLSGCTSSMTSFSGRVSGFTLTSRPQTKCQTSDATDVCCPDP